MKLMRCLTTASLVTASSALAACSAGESANPAPRCEVASDCDEGLSCYRGFCVVDEELEPSEPDDSTVDPGAPDGENAGEGGDDASASPVDASVDAGALRLDGGRMSQRDTGAGPAPTGMMEPKPGAPVDAGAAPIDSGPILSDPNSPCARDGLNQRVEAFFAAMAAGDARSLRLHPALRYTENGQAQMLGAGVFRGRPRVQFARHVFDEARCSSVTEAVLNESTGRIVYGVRLRYLDDQLLEAEAMVVPRNGQFYDPDAVIASGAESWMQPVPAAMRMSREALTQLAANYLDSTTDESLLPPHAPTCERRQNGRLMEEDGSCGVVPGDRPFTERRYPLVDETAGVVTAVVIYERFLGMYLFKAQGGVMQNISIVGGAMSRSSGW